MSALHPPPEERHAIVHAPLMPDFTARGIAGDDLRAAYRFVRLPVPAGIGPGFPASGEGPAAAHRGLVVRLLPPKAG